MKSYIVPPDMNETEKIIGGVLDLHQFLWILGGLIFGAIVFVALFPLFNKYSLVFGGIAACSGLPFAFVKKKDLPLFEYWKRKRVFDKKEKHLINKRKIND